VWTSPTNLGAPPSPAMADKATAKSTSLEKEDVPTAGEPGEHTPAKTPAHITETGSDESDKLVLDVFGFDILHQLQGKTWDERGQGVQAARARVAQDDMGSIVLESDFFRASCCVARIALTDKVMPVFFDGLDLCKLLLGDFTTKHSLKKEVISQGLDMLVPIIVAKTSDRNARSIEGTRQALVYLARQPTVGCQPVMAYILTPINAKEVASIRGRLELISHLIDEFGFSKTSGLSLSAVMGFVRPHLEAPDEKVRRAAVEVTVSCYNKKGERTMKYCSNLKPALLKLLEQRFAEVDQVKGGGKAVKSSARGGLPEVRGTKVRRSGAPQRNNTSSGSSRHSTSSGSMGSRGLNQKPLAPLEVSPSSRERRTGSRERAIMEQDETAALHADLFAASVPNDIIRSPINGDANVMSPQQYGMAIDPAGNSSLAMHEDPNYIPSPTAQGPGSDPFSVDDEDFMNEIEDFAQH